MKKKALLVTTVSGFVPQFEMNNVRILKELGYEIHYAANYRTPSYGSDNKRLDGTGIIRHQVDFCRSPYSLKNFRAYWQLRRLMAKESFNLLHCHTPMGGALGRIAARRSGIRAVAYTAHGFHFYRGAFAANWLLYYTAERFLARYTDQLICINREDLERAGKFPAGNVNYIPGVGIDLELIRQIRVDAEEKRRSLGIPPGSRILLSVGELIPRKNHEVVIRALKLLGDPKLCYLICGHGRLRGKLEGMARELGVDGQVIFAGYRSDVLEIYPLADLFVLPSLQEGLSVALMEAMASGVPAVCSDIRGNRDLISGGRGILVGRNTPAAYCRAVDFLLSHREAAAQMRDAGLENIKNYDVRLIGKKMRKIYARLDAKTKGMDISDEKNQEQRFH